MRQKSHAIGLSTMIATPIARHLVREPRTHLPVGDRPIAPDHRQRHLRLGLEAQNTGRVGRIRADHHQDRAQKYTLGGAAMARSAQAGTKRR